MFNVARCGFLCCVVVGRREFEMMPVKEGMTDGEESQIQ
jgi:hypothetical protein